MVVSHYAVCRYDSAFSNSQEHSVYALEPDLRSRSRFPLVRRDATTISAAEFVVLVACGVIAALGVMMLDFSLRLPGHAILRAVLPMSCGLALVPRRNAGLSMSAVALGTAGIGGFAGWHDFGAGSTTSLVLIGPLLDAAAAWARRNGRLAVSFALAGMGTNLVALVVRGVAKMYEPSKRPFGSWLAQAAWSYPLCGLVAGAVAAVICFRLRGPSTPSEREPAP